MPIQVGKNSLTDMQYITNMSQLSSENAMNIINVVQENKAEIDSEDEELIARDLQKINVGVTFESKSAIMHSPKGSILKSTNLAQSDTLSVVWTTNVDGNSKHH